jgi:chromosome segregation protein
LGTRRAVFTEELARLYAGIEERRRHVAALRSAQERYAGEREEALAELRRLEIERETMRSRLGYLEDAEAQYRGYDAAARELLLAHQEDPRRFGGLKGPIVAFVSVPREYRPAVEAALGPFLSTLVVDSLEDVQMLLGYLGDREIGRVAFLPISLAQPSAAVLPLPVELDPTICGRALDLIQVTGIRSDAVRVLLGDVLIVRDLGTALRVRAAGFGGRIVTLEGETLSAGGLLTAGGRIAEQGNVVGRSEEIAEMRSTLRRLEDAMPAWRGRAAEADARLRAGEATIAEGEAAAAREDGRRADAERHLTLLDAEAARLAEEIGALVSDQRAAEQEISTQDERYRALADRVAAHAAEMAARDREAETMAALLRDRTGELREIRDSMTALAVAAMEVDGRRAALQARVEEIRRARSQAASRDNDLIAEEALLAAEAERLLEEEEAARKRREECLAEASHLEARLASLDTERAEMAARRADVLGQHEEAAARAEALAEDAHRVEVRQAQIDAEVGSARRRIEEEFGRGWEAAATDVPESMDRDEMLGRIEALRGLIAVLGPVNLLAIEEHRIAADRAAVLREQCDDVRGAVAALRLLIVDLEGMIRERFDDTFRAVNKEFGVVFTRLFGGGQAGLDLISAEGSDEPGIEIVVQPPGKNLRSLSALSGGERVMVSLALIFAMLRVRPSPFCVFDEVEAALDDANTRNVASVLVELAANTQIIIITHNKATMEACDVLFGVTMEEPGISHMVSVRLQDRDRVRESQPVA